MLRLPFLLAPLAALALAACQSAPSASSAPAGDLRQPPEVIAGPVASAAPAADPLAFDAGRYTTQQVSAGGQSVTVRAWEGVPYVSRPAQSDYQVMNIYIPEAYFNGGQVGRYNAKTAPIFLPNQIGGYMPAKPGTPAARGMDGEARSDAPNAIAMALVKGYVVASPGARGRTQASGKAPAAIVDLKAAVRWLRYNDSRMPGDTDKIISNGTSAGGALSALLGASGNHDDYAAALKEAGAAEERDHIFAVSAYCPITNLEHADAAYEWQFRGIDDYKKTDISMLDYKVQRKTVAGTLNAEQKAVSAALASAFAPYLNSLGLRNAYGRLLTLDAEGQGTFRRYLAALVTASAQKALNEGQNLSSFGWLQIKDGEVTGLDFERYLRHLGRMKTPPAFDALDLSSGENQLFGDARHDKRHFTAYSAEHAPEGQAQRADKATVRQMNAMSYAGWAGSWTARYWRIRQGSKDSDTSLAIPAILALTLQNRSYVVDFALSWERPHGGDYDLDELFAWMDAIDP